MLSIIISSYKPDYFSALEKNIAETCGIPYEIIKIDNPGLMGICEAYNKGAAKARFDNLLFLHEDVEFVNQNWGREIIIRLQQEKIGVIGLAGSNYVPFSPFAWWEHLKNTFINIIQCDQNKNIIKKYSLIQDINTITLDGVFLSCRKNLFNEYKFDEAIKGFHGYDLNFSTRVAEKYTNIICHSIVLKHFSEGNPDRKWLEELIENRKAFKAPTYQKTDKQLEAYFFIKYIALLKKFNLPFKNVLHFINPKYIGWKLSLQTFLKLLFSNK